MKRDLIVFGEDWGGLPSSTQHLIRRLSQDRKIVWVNSIGLRRPTLTVNDCKRAWQKLTTRSVSNKGASKTCATPESLTVVNPSTLPAPRTMLGRKLAAGMLRNQLAPIIAQANLHNPILWTSLPTAVDVSDQLGTSSLVYYCGDDFSSLAGVDHHTVAQREQELVEKADLILTASETLFTRFSDKCTRLLPHGVDYSLFSTPCPRAEDLPNNGRPIAGFYGSLSEWLDYKMLAKTITLLPDWDFVFIGKPCEAALALKQHDNVTLLGPKSHHELPGYSQHWSASLLPFTNNDQIKACNPLKLREYLAAGRPVISTPFPAVNEYRTFVSVVQNAEEMAKALRNAAEQAPNAHQQTAVSAHTWDARAEKLATWLDAL
ncbi:glycosyl transferase [Enterovibrio norvegicus FF-162]|uniref:glycosyltransferase n=1 Tax=Enterovibrio norvegicus TaxID=188144 RepID=UPI0002DA65E6|nr:glycosyltransferase [Enterovibrio norvegicus]OEE86534.1 glycosyl transferase [Enterovibrio norvegicus FF-162]